jgi:TolB-like protein/thioredoxin-like negative regulator of GroEL
MKNSTNRPARFLKELKRRNVYRVTVVYLAVAFLTLQVIDLLIPATTLPEWVASFLLAIAIMGFPVAVIAAWAFEMTPEGIRWTQPDNGGAAGSEPSRPILTYVFATALLLAAGAVWWYLSGPGSFDPESEGRTIAVMPFHTLGTDQANAFTEGIHLGVLTNLSNVSGLDVISRTSVKVLESSNKSLPEIADALGATWVLQADVQEVGSNVQINARLINARDDRQVWAQSYRRTLTTDNIFDIQTELSLAIIEALHARLTPSEKQRVDRKPTVSLEAYGLHNLGRTELDKRDEPGMRAAVSHFEQALKLDPDYTLAWVGLADSSTLLYDYRIDRSDSRLVTADAAIQRALQLDPLSAEAHASLGLFYYAQQNAPKSIVELTLAVELMPNYADAQSWLAWALQLAGEPEGGLQSARRAVAVNPLSGEAISNLTLSYLAMGDYEKALTQSRHNQTILPSWATAKFYESLALYHLGRFAEVQERLDQVSVDWTENGAESLLALSLIATGDEVAARQLLAQIEGGGDPFSTALVYLALGEHESALDGFERVKRWHAWPVLAMRYFFPEVLGALAANDRYQEFFEQMKEDWSM